MFFQTALVLLLARNALCDTYTAGIFAEDVGMMYDFIDTIEALNAEMNISIHLVGRTYVEINDGYNVLKSTCDLLDRQAVAIFGPTVKKHVDIVESICSPKKIPQVLSNWVGPLKGETQINFYPSVETLTKSYIDIVSSMNWTHFTIIYTVPEDILKVTKLFEGIQREGLTADIEYLHPDNGELARLTAERIQKSNQKFFVVECPAKHSESIISFLQRFGLVTKEYSYLFTNIDTNDGDIVYFRHNGVDVTRIKLPYPYKLQNGKSIGSVYEALHYDATRTFMDALRSLKPVPNNSLNCKNDISWSSGALVVHEIIQNTHMGITGEISFGPDRYRNTIDLCIEKIIKGDFKQVGTWNPWKGITSIHTEENEGTYDWRNKDLVVVTSLIEPYVMAKPSSDPTKGNDRYEGYVIDLLEMISKLRNFKYRIKVIEGGNDKLIQEVVEGKADLAISDIIITNERMELVDFTYPFMHTGISILFQKPLKLPPSFFNFARPFSNDFWKAIAVAFVVVTISLFIIGRLCESEWQRLSYGSNYVISQLTILNAIWFTTGSLFRQNTRVKIRSIPGRIVAASWWLFCFLLVAMYIVALIFHRIEYEEAALFSDVKTLVSNSRKFSIKYGAKLGGSTMDFFRDANIPVYQEIYRYMEDHKEDMVTHNLEGVERAETSLYAFFTDSATIDYIIKRHCQLTMYGGLLNQNAYGIAVIKNNYLLTSLDTAILTLSSSGKLDTLKSKWWEEKQIGGGCKYIEDEEEISPLFIIDVSGVIHITVIGTVLAIISAIVEFLYHVYQLSKKRKITFCRTFKYELKRCFGKKQKNVQVSELETRAIPRDEDATSAIVELT